MSAMYPYWAVGICATATILLRAVPFLLFGGRKEPSALLSFLGKVLPFSIIGMLVIYCLRSVRFSSPEQWVPELAAGIAVVLLHLWRKNSLVSIIGGTALYMFLIQVVF